MLKIELIDNQTIWDNFLTSQKHSNILQSWAWGEFQKTFGRKIWRIGIFDENTLIGVALAQHIPTKLRSHIYISNGPVILEAYLKEAIEKLKGYVKALGIQEKVVFVRMDPLLENTKANNKLLKSANLVKASTHIQAENKWILDISKDEQTLLSEMEKNTRYEINKSQKEGVEVVISKDISDYQEFEKLFVLTAKRQKFIHHPLEYYKTQFETMTKFDNYAVVIAKKDSKVISAALIGYFGDSAFYLHAASINERQVNKLMGPQAVVWGAILQAKKRGMKYFDFWGIASDDNPKNTWAGFTRFKKGFGGLQFNTVRAYDLPLSWQYYFVSILEKYRELWGGLYFKLKTILKK